MKYVIAGGSGQVGGVITRALAAGGHEVVGLSRGAGAGGAARPVRSVRWDARTLGPWAQEIDGADVVVNLAGAASTAATHPPTAARSSSRGSTRRA
jgi:nucleoside-diphosphate-sugar epimerase